MSAADDQQYISVYSRHLVISSLKDKSFDPGEVRFFRADGIVFEPEFIPDLIQKSFGWFIHFRLIYIIFVDLILFLAYIK